MEVRVASQIGVAVEGDIHAVSARGGHQCQELGRTPAVRRCAHVGVRQMDGHTCPAANLDARGERVQGAGAIVAVMWSVVST